MQHNASERGNVLVIILIGIVLFVGLIFAISKNWAGISSMSTQEQARLSAVELLQYGNGLRPIVDRMLLLGGVSDTNTSGNGILFSASGANAAYGAVGAQPTTEIFNSSGGNAVYMTPSPATCLSTCSYEFSGQYTVTGVGSDSKSELVMLVVDIPQNICEKANSLLSLGWAGVPAGGALTLTRFNGTNYGDLGGANPITLTGGANEFVGKRAFCYRESAGAQRYIYLHVIRAR